MFTGSLMSSVLALISITESHRQRLSVHKTTKSQSALFRVLDYEQQKSSRIASGGHGAESHPDCAGPVVWRVSAPLLWTALPESGRAREPEGLSTPVVVL